MLSHEKSYQTLEKQISEKEALIQVLLGPRQVGKTTILLRLKEKLKVPTIYSTTDDSQTYSKSWIERQWAVAKGLGHPCILMIDEIQKIEGWSDVVKRIWDNQRIDKDSKIKLILSGSSSLKIQKGLSDSLTGRFELIRAHHWGFEESKKKFKIKFDQYLLNGGYPGSYKFLKNKSRFNNFIAHSIINTVIEKDILQFHKVKSPALFRQTFALLMSYPAQVISYNKLLGQIQEKGNVELVKYYIELFQGAFLVEALEKYSASEIRSKISSPKILPMCTALISENIKHDSSVKGRLFESMVGQDLIKAGLKTYYWQEGNYELDFCVEIENKLYAIEVKSGRNKNSTSLERFRKKYPKARPVFITLENYENFEKDPLKFLQKM